jgi:hypothetical protein
VTAKNASWNGTIKPAESTSFGFIGTGTPSAATPTCTTA